MFFRDFFCYNNPRGRRGRELIYKIETWPSWTDDEVNVNDEHGFRDMYTRILHENDLKLNG